MERRNLFCCGLACTGKSRIVKKMSSIYDITTVYADFNELCTLHSKFKTKHQDPVIQILYTIKQTMDSSKASNSIFDRSPISDLCYELIHEELKTEGLGVIKLQHLLNWKLFKTICEEFKTLYILIEDDDYEAEKDILAKMVERDNKIDILTANYVKAQRKIFKMITKEISNYHALVKPKEMKIHTQMYYNWLENEVAAFIIENGYVQKN